MRLHTNIPTRGEVSRLFANNDPASVSIYLPTDPTSNGQAERIALKNLVSEATRQLEEAGIPKRDIADIEAHFEDLAGDGQFWKFQARTLAVFATPDSLVGYRLPNRLSEMVAVADRFHLKPLLRAITFPQTALVLALSQKSSRLFEVLPEGSATEVDLPDLPQGVEDAARIVHVDDRAPKGKTQSSAAEKSHLRIYSRTIDRVIRPLIAGRDVPLILAAAEPLDSIYRSVNTYPHLAEKSIAGNPDGLSETEIASKAREILDDLYARQLADLHDLYEKRLAEGRAGNDIANIARAATYGMVHTLLVDIDSVVPGFIHEDGSVEFAESDDGVAFGIVDEIARRVWESRGTVLAVRREDVPGGGDVAAILRYSF